MLRVFIGFDSKEPAAYHVLSHSIIKRASAPVAIIPLALPQLKDIYTRPRGPTESTEFSMTRFLVPHLCYYQGHAIFMDSDMLCLTDIHEVMKLIDPKKAVSVCPHEYTPKNQIKFLGQPQTAYPRKNWSSFMVFNNLLCRPLMPAYVNSASGLDLHRFKWTHDSTIGYLPLEWNWLVEEYEATHNPKVLHYTLGGPWFVEHKDCDYAAHWFGEHMLMTGHQ